MTTSSLTGCRPLSLIEDLVYVARKTLGEFAAVCAYRKSNPDIPIMQSAKHWSAKNFPGPLNGACCGRVVVQRGNEIRSKAARCTIKSRKEAGDTIDLHAACASEIMASSIQLQIKILNDNSVSRIFQNPDFKGMQMTFYRCAM
jgi:hypothetical protein